MKCYVRKSAEETTEFGWDSSYFFDIDRKSPRTVFSSIFDEWYYFGSLGLEAIYEDLFIIGISIFAIDKEVSRANADDKWTRNLEVSIPVQEFELWKTTVDKWNKILAFLTGDNWQLVFRKTDVLISKRKKKPKASNIKSMKDNDCVCLFSGGLDSFCGAIKLLSEAKNPLLVGHNEYPKLRTIQEEFCEAFRVSFSSQKVQFVDFSANAHSPQNKEGNRLYESENTSRSRSLLFLCAALSFASLMGKNKTVYIPENGFIGMNVPLTDSRVGSCTTRTTHPYFLNMFKEILKDVGIENEIKNIFEYKTKKEIVDMVKDKNAFREKFGETISCSHPTEHRFKIKDEAYYPQNCGFCYPCLVRRASLNGLNEDGNYYYVEKGYDFKRMMKERSIKAGDLVAVISSVNRFIRYKNDEATIRDLVDNTGSLSEKELEEFIRVYKVGMEELIQLFGGEEEVEKLCNE